MPEEIRIPKQKRSIEKKEALKKAGGRAVLDKRVS